MLGNSAAPFSSRITLRSIRATCYLFGDNAVSAFTKTDIAFGDDYDAYAFKGGFRVNW